jgi:hypothetical protein
MMMFFATPVSLPRRKPQPLQGGSSLSFCVPLALLLACGAALAQAPNCDEGVIRLPDRSGTVVICSALAAQMPQLARQLTDATRMLGSQQGQMAELTRLVRGLNGVSQGIGIERQAQMLQTCRWS